jgi:uncharacterized membrane protein YhaH (DUF805 family)
LYDLYVANPIKILKPESNLSNPYNAPAADLSQMSASDDTYEPRVWAIHGRIGRLRYLAYGLLQMLIAVPIFAVVAGVMSLMGSKVMMAGVVIAYIPLIALSFILAKRRFNDMNHSGWLSLLLIIPLVSFFIGLWLIFGAGDKESNNFGPPPGPNSTPVIIGAFIFPALIVIIGILAAIALPAYQGYTQRARAAQMEVQQPASALPESSQ